MKVAMYVCNDIRTDARVLREAASLGAVGHDVVVVGLRTDGTPARERGDGFDIVRVPVPVGPHLAWSFVRYPWRSRRMVMAHLAAGRRRGWSGIGEVSISTIVGVAAVGWTLVRTPFFLIERVLREALGRPSPSSGDAIDWVVGWRWRTLGWARTASRMVPDADVHHGHDLSGLPAAVMAARGSGVAVYDSHEIFLESTSNATRPAWLRRRFARLEQRWIERTVALVTVNEALAAELGRRYAVPPVVVVHNCPPRWTPPAVPEDRIRAAAGIPHDAAVILYHGVLGEHRGLDQLAAAILVPGLERAHAVFLGYGPEKRRLENLAREPHFAGRLHVLDAVPPGEVVSWVAGADIDVMALQPSTLNHILSTPNKLFESIAAGVPVVASDFAGLRRIVLDDPDGPLGELCDPRDPHSIAAAIRRILDLEPDAAQALRVRCLASAHRTWNWETESLRLVRLYADLASAAGVVG